MRRTLALVLIGGAVAASCSSAGTGSAPTDPAAGERADEEHDDSTAAGDELAAGGSVGAAAPELPGLLDPSDEPIAKDRVVRTGVLANGLRYYVRYNDNPGSKAELRLAVRAGSVDEQSRATGVAHFVEHMLFNGTERFPENELIDVLRSFGAAFGADVNASTSYDETVYRLTVPNAPESVELGMNVLEQWLSFATFDPDQVVAERGVVLDEWRVRTQSTSGRLFEVAEQLFLRGSPYAGRSPIGTSDSIERMTTDDLRDFYDQWYRPDNAAVIVVGDIDVDQIVADIERLFGPAAPRTPAPPERAETEFEPVAGPAFGLHADPDQQTVDVEVTLPIPDTGGNGTAAWRTAMLDEIAFDALIRRLDRDVASATAPFDRIVVGSNGFVDALDAPALYSFTDAARVTETLQALLDEYERAHRYGFTAEEIEVSKSTLRARYDSRFAGRDSAQDSHYADEYVDHFLTGSPYPSIEDEHELLTRMLDAVTPAAVDLRFRARWANTEPHVIISTPEGVADRMPSDAEVLDMIAALPGRDITPRDQRRDLPAVLVDRPAAITPASIEEVLPFDDPIFDPVDVTFPNGVRVILAPNTIVEGQVFLRAASPGGSSLVADEDVVDALYAADVVTASGVADFDQADLAQIVADRDVALDASITPYLDNFAGSTATDDAEALFQLLHLYMTRPRVDAVALQQVERRVGPIVADPGSDPRVAGDDALLDARHPGELRYAVLPEPGEFAGLDVAGVERVWRDRYGDASDWTFVFAGDFDTDELIELAGSYLATLPASGTTERWIDVGSPPPADVVSTTVEAGTGDTASVTLLFTSPVDSVDARLRANADVATELIGDRLTDVIRERLGESYSPQAASSVTTDPDPVVETRVRVTGSPERVAAIADIVVAELADLAQGGATETEFSNAYAQVEEAYGFVNNGEFLEELLNHAIHPALDIDHYVLELAELSSVTSASVLSYVRSHVPADRYIQVTVVPR